MSRSRKKIPACDVAGRDNSWKKIYNRKLRRCHKYDDMPNGNAYKKYNCSWNISDFKQHHLSFEQYLESCWNYSDQSIEELRNEYERYYKRK